MLLFESPDTFWPQWLSGLHMLNTLSKPAGSSTWLRCIDEQCLLNMQHSVLLAWEGRRGLTVAPVADDDRHRADNGHSSAGPPAVS